LLKSPNVFVFMKERKNKSEDKIGSISLSFFYYDYFSKALHRVYFIVCICFLLFKLDELLGGLNNMQSLVSRLGS
jgi:hypothetical protein